MSSNKLAFQIEVNRVLEILSNDIYDSPYALLRENIQNAYDAILMRRVEDENFEPLIEVIVKDGIVTIKDNGIGMNAVTVANNFWKAGSSGKNNTTAQKAGVVGTFGIGAMANFGVCKSLKVVTHFMNGDETIETFALRENLSVTEECIDVKTIKEKREPGTTIIAELDHTVKFDLGQALKYLSPYVKYVQIPITINENKVSQNDFSEYYEVSENNLLFKKGLKIKSPDLRFNLYLFFTKQYQVKIRCTDIIKGEQPIIGNIALSQGANNIYGLRNYFGLASIPVPGYFNLGGIVNLSVLHPTAGREALSRESITLVSSIISICEQYIVREISESEIADNNLSFQQYIVALKEFSLGSKIKIEVRPDNERWELVSIKPKINGRDVYYYTGRDDQIIHSYGNENSYLVLISPDNPRRKIQIEYLKKARIPEVADVPQVQSFIERRNLSLAEASLVIYLTNTLNEDYLISDCEVKFAVITHGVPNLVLYTNGKLKIYLSRTSTAVQQVLSAYDKAYEIFSGFVKDFVRSHLYSKFSNYVPSSTKQGADTLQKILQKNRELYKYESSDLGKMEQILKDYVTGDIDLPEVIRESSKIARTYSQYVGTGQVGKVETEIPSIISNPETESEEEDKLSALPPIIRSEVSTEKKILKTDKEYSQLNNFTLFLSLSDRVLKSHREFFMEPHTSKVIWSMHRVVYIFTHVSNRLSLYYDIELKERLADETTGGKQIPTTTIITSDHIFIPIPGDLIKYFDVQEGEEKEFYVRFDIIVDSGI